MNKRNDIVIAIFFLINFSNILAQKPGSGVSNVDWNCFITFLVEKIEWNGGDVIYVGEFINVKRSGFGALISGAEIVLYDDYSHEYQGDVDQNIKGFDDFYNLFLL